VKKAPYYPSHQTPPYQPATLTSKLDDSKNNAIPRFPSAIPTIPNPAPNHVPHPHAYARPHFLPKMSRTHRSRHRAGAKAHHTDNICNHRELCIYFGGRSIYHTGRAHACRFAREWVSAHEVVILPRPWQPYAHTRSNARPAQRAASKTSR
jgi:hypothetical protein